MIAPGAWLAAPPPLAAAFIVGEGGLRIGGTGKPPRFHVLDVLGHPLGLFGLGFGIRQGRLLGQLARVHDHKPERCQGEPPVSVLHLHTPDDTLPMPPARGLLPGPARFFEQQGQGALLLPPRFQLLPHRTGAWDQRDEPHPLLQAQAQRAFTVRFAIRHNPAHPVESQRQTFLNGDWGLCAITRIAIPHAQAQWEAAITADPETQEHLLEIIVPIFAVPIGRTRRDRAPGAGGLGSGASSS